MDNNRILIGFTVLVAAFLAFPVVAKQLRGGQAAATVEAASSASGTQSAGSAGGGQSGGVDTRPEYNIPPTRNEGNLTGTSWRVLIMGYTVKLTFGPNGVAYVTHPMCKAMVGRDYVEGHWRVEYNTIYFDFAVGAQEVHEKARISGDKLYYIYPKNDKADLMQNF